MKEITRIHLAKTAYDIEIAAKKQLEKYVKSLELYTQDEDVLLDIEIRMTEILSERSVKTGGVISVDDVEAIRAQLGEPHEFSDESGDIAVGSEAAGDPLDTRRYYRDLDGAVLGGVLSGFSVYFGFNPLWSRLAFILLTLMSGGAAILVYIVLWIAVPPARTAAERLQLTGKPVNLAAIRELNETQGTAVNKTAQATRNFFRVSFGIASVGGAILAFIATLWGSIGIFWGTSDNSPIADWVPGEEPLAWVVYVLAILSGLLLTVMFSVLAYATLSRSWTKRVGLILGGVVVAGIMTSTGAVTAGFMYGWQEQVRFEKAVSDSMEETEVNLPDDFSEVEELTFARDPSAQDYNDMVYEYVVDEGAPRYVLTAPSGVRPVIDIDDESAHITVKQPKALAYYSYKMTIYGPEIETLNADSGTINYRTVKQDSLKVSSSALEGASLSIDLRGEYGEVQVVGTGEVKLSQATVGDLAIDSKAGGLVVAGVVRSLEVTQPDACPSSDDDLRSRVSVMSVSSGSMAYNGKDVNVETRDNLCALFVVGDEDAIDDYIYERV